MTVHSRAQADLLHAMADIQLVANAHPEQSAGRKSYGRWCHRFPILVRTNGLCSAIAFLETKAAADGPDRRFLEHMSGVLGVAPEHPSVAVAGWGVSQYIHKTRRLLEAAVYYKRFAVSVLKVQGDTEADETASAETAAP